MLSVLTAVLLNNVSQRDLQAMYKFTVTRIKYFYYFYFRQAPKGDKFFWPYVNTNRDVSVSNKYGYIHEWGAKQEIYNRFQRKDCLCHKIFIRNQL